MGISTKNLRQGTTFASLAELEEHADANIYGVVTSFHEPKKSNGTDMFVNLQLADPLSKLAVNLFGARSDLPELGKLNLVIKIMHIKIQKWHDKLQGAGTLRASGCSYVVFSDKGVRPLHTYPSLPYVPTEQDKVLVPQLQRWVQNREVITDNRHKRTVHELHAGEYFDITCQILSFQIYPEHYIFKAWDGTDIAKLELGSNQGRASVAEIRVNRMLFSHSTDKMVDSWLHLRNAQCVSQDHRLIVIIHPHTKWRVAPPEEVETWLKEVRSITNNQEATEPAAFGVASQNDGQRVSHSTETEPTILSPLIMPSMGKPALPVSTITEILNYPEATMIFCCKARVVRYTPCDFLAWVRQDHASGGWYHYFRLVLSDDTGELPLDVWKHDAERLGFPPATLRTTSTTEDACELIAKRLDILQAPSFWSVKSFYSDKKSPNERRYRIL